MTTLKGRTGPGTWVRVAQTSVSDFVKKVGDTMTGNLVVQTMHVGRVWGGTYDGLQSGANVQGSGGATAGALLLPKEGQTPNSYLTGGPAGTVHLRGDVTNPSGGQDVIVDANGHMTVPGFLLGTEAWAAGWSGSAVVALRAGWAMVDVSCMKSSAITSGQLILTLPAGFRPLTNFGDIFRVAVNSAGTAFLVSLDDVGEVKIRGTGTMPPASASFYFGLSYPVA